MNADRGWGPHFREGGAVEFRLWAPSQSAVSLEYDGRFFPMSKADGWFSTELSTAAVGSSYGFRLDDGRFVPDPASRRQLSGLAGHSMLTSPATYGWRYTAWRGRPWNETVLYEIHVGTFTPEGTFAAAAEKLEELAAVGITAVELMPVAQFPGNRGWGYDGVLHYAPHAAYGAPDDLKAFIDQAHGLGMMVFLDVVYNHFGGLDNYLSVYAPEFFREDKPTPWGPAIAFERPEIRRYFIDNALYWLGEYRFDGLRLDAVDQIEDEGDVHFLEEVASAVRQTFTDRHVHLVVENPASAPDLILRSHGKAKLYDADWNDDFHHSVRVAAANEGSGHYKKFTGDPWRNVARTLTEGPIFIGDPILKTGREQPGAWHADAYVHFLHNHDQIGNRVFGERLWHLLDDRKMQLWMAVLLLSPQIPLMFMGDHFHAESPFHFFADYEGEIADAIRAGRAEEAPNFGGVPLGRSVREMPDPVARSTFEKCKLDWREAESEKGRRWTAFVRNLLDLRRAHLVPVLSGRCEATILSSEPEIVSVNWKLDNCLIELRANFSERSHRGATIQGEIIYRDGFIDEGNLGPHSIIVAASNK